MYYPKFNLIFYKNNEEVFRDTFKNNIKSDSKLEFNMLEFNTTIDIKDKTFLRENDEYIFFLDFKKQECQFALKKEDITFDVNVEECDINISESTIVIEYFIETDEARNKIVIEKSE